MASDVIKREHALTVAKNRAEEAEKAKGDFLANITHEIRSPLTVMLGMNDLLLAEPRSSFDREKLTHIADSGRYLMNIINDVLDLSMIDAGRLEVNETRFDLHALIYRVAEQKRTLLPKTVVLETEVSLATNIVFGDALRLEQILTNLLGNAIKFTENGKITLTCSLVTATDDHDLLTVRVQDTGIGISETQLNHIFDAFTQVDTRINRRFPGTGLGLSISRQLTELMGGRISAESEPGEGSIFGFELKLKRTNHIQANEDAQELSQTDLKDLRILVVDDSPMIRMVITEFLESTGCIVAVAKSGQTGIDRVRASPDEIDLILMDIQMPDVDGITATRLLKADPVTKTVHIIAITAGLLGEQRQRVLDAGAEAVIAKPLDLKTLRQVIHQVMYSPPATSIVCPVTKLASSDSK